MLCTHSIRLLEQEMDVYIIKLFIVEYQLEFSNLLTATFHSDRDHLLLPYREYIYVLQLNPKENSLIEK